MPNRAVTGRRPRPASWVKDVLGIAWVLAAAAAVMAPALAHGSSLGPFDIITSHGLSQHTGTVVHNRQTADIITEMIPWTSLAWTQVHQGHLPLWNPYSALGTPLAFNWQSATFSVPALLGYLVPLRLDFTVQMLATLVIAGTGVYVLGRVLRLSVFGCVMAATVFELSGEFFGWLGWPVASVMAWMGWLFAAAILIVRGRHRVRAIVFFALATAFAVYSGQPDALFLLVLGLVVFVVVLLGLRGPWFTGSGPILRPAVDLVLATAAGAALGAPLILPGLQLTSGAIRATISGSPALPPHDLVSVILQGFDGVPVAGSRWFGYLSGNSNYLQGANFVGVIAVVLVVLAIACRWRRPAVVAFSAVGLAMTIVVFFTPVTALLDAVPGGIRWHRGEIVLAFALAVLAGMGADVLYRSYHERSVQRWATRALAALAFIVAILWLVGRGHLPRADAAIRAHSFFWPVVEIAVGLAILGVLALLRRRTTAQSDVDVPLRRGIARWVCLGVLACETAALIGSGAPLWSSSKTYLPPTPAEVALEDAVGPSVVGVGVRSCIVPAQLAIPQDVNVAYGVHEFDDYDPIIPKDLFISWQNATGQPAGGGNPVSVFCPAVTSATQARRYGLGFVLEPAGNPGPQGAVFDRRVGDESLYRIPGASAATLTSLEGGSLPAAAAPGTPVNVTHPDPASWKIVTDSASPQVLRLHLTAVPGWHATIDGRALPLSRLSGAMLQARLPAGRHTVELNYWPDTFSIGLGLAACSVVGMVVALGLSRRRRGVAPSAPGGR
jgi:hypothetical protein